MKPESSHSAHYIHFFVLQDSVESLCYRFLALKSILWALLQHARQSPVWVAMSQTRNSPIQIKSMKTTDSIPFTSKISIASSLYNDMFVMYKFKSNSLFVNWSFMHVSVHYTSDIGRYRHSSSSDRIISLDDMTFIMVSLSTLTVIHEHVKKFWIISSEYHISLEHRSRFQHVNTHSIIDASCILKSSSL